MPEQGDRIIYCGQLYLLGIVLTLQPGNQIFYAIRQDDWHPFQHWLVPWQLCQLNAPLVA